MPSKLLPLSTMARYLRVTSRWLREEAEAGRIPAVRTGDGFLFDPEAVERELLGRAKDVTKPVRGRGGA